MLFDPAAEIVMTVFNHPSAEVFSEDSGHLDMIVRKDHVAQHIIGEVRLRIMDYLGGIASSESFKLTRASRQTCELRKGQSLTLTILFNPMTTSETAAGGGGTSKMQLPMRVGKQILYYMAVC
jgi:hypothetical protein